MTNNLLHFDERHHAYSVRGRRVLSVTQLLRISGHCNPRWFTEEARLRGVYVHQAIDWYLKGELDEDTLDTGLRPYIAAAKNYILSLGDAELVGSEMRLVDDKLWFAGTNDVAFRIGKRIRIPDWKTGSPEAYHRLQLAAYAHLVSIALNVPMRDIDREGVYLKPDGDFKPEPFTERSDWKVFDGARVNAQWRYLHDARARKELDEEGAANDDRAA